ncbi:MAG: superinfection immunity protein [Dermatophilaceae bacterium]
MSQQIVTDQRSRPVSTIVSWVAAIVTGGYLLPWAIAATRGKRNAWGIFWVNLLLGWTIIGWVVALVMSLNSHNLVAVSYPSPPRYQR